MFLFFADVGVRPSGSRLQPRVQPLELCQVFGTVASRREGCDRAWCHSACLVSVGGLGCIYICKKCLFFFFLLKVPALFGIDTRMLTKVIRDKVLQAQRPAAAPFTNGF